jgi:mRNA interferase RelE/StbE
VVAIKQLKKLDKSIRKKIENYLDKKISKAKDPCIYAEPLYGDKTGLWRFRVENYRIICDIYKKELYIIIMRVGHRKDIYD